MADESLSGGGLSISSVLSSERVVLLDKPDKNSALKKLIGVLSQASEIEDEDELEKAIFEREEMMSTGIGLGVGVPHVRLKSVKDIVMAVGLVKEPIADYESLDDEPVRLIFMIAARNDQHREDIRLLKQVSSQVKDEQRRCQIFRAESAEQLYNYLTR